jgi:ABC-type multidrug transport system ATPase subunit
VCPGECFGLLGVNGAGKTTTLGCLSGEFPPSEGQAFLAQKNIVEDTAQVKRQIGYCPQFDALFPLMTGREHLNMYARLKGVSESDIKAVVDEQIQRMDLTKYADLCSKGYSGGNKRKLSVACALIGDPAIVFLDEPSTGMDPVAKRFMWDIINQISNTGNTSLILTTHSMEECESLCSRIGIMVAGVFKCLGTRSRLKSRFGNGYQVEIVLRDEREQAELHVQQVLSWLQQTFPGFVILEKQHVKMRLQLPNTASTGQNIPIGDVFRAIEEAKESLRIESYSCSLTTLEQIFNNFAKEESDRSEIKNDDGSQIHPAPPPGLQGSNAIEMT